MEKGVNKQLPPWNWKDWLSLVLVFVGLWMVWWGVKKSVESDVVPAPAAQTQALKMATETMDCLCHCQQENESKGE